MKAVVYKRYGSPDLLSLEERAKPVPGVHEVLVKVHAMTVNRTDCATVRAKPFFMRIVTGLFRPKKQVPGTEFAGVIEAAGQGVNAYNVGDGVFGFNDMGACSQAEYLTISEQYIAKIPDGFTFTEAAPSLEGAHYAYNFINKVHLEPGQHVLVNGSTGAIGSAAVQLLKAFGVHVTAVCATDNIALVKSLGADRVIDYTEEDFTQDTHRYAYVFDCVGKSSYFKCRRLLLPGGVYLSSDLGFLAQNIYLPLITPLLKPLLGNTKTLFPGPVDLPGSIRLIKKLMDEGKFRAMIDDKAFSFDAIKEAYRYVEAGHKRGNVVIPMIEEERV